MASPANSSWIQSIGRACYDLASFVGGLFAFVGSTLQIVARRGVPVRVILAQVYEIGVLSLPLTAIAAFAIGVVMALQMLTLLQKFGVVQYVAVGVGIGMTRELGPVVTALMVAGRAGSGITAEIGSMKVTRQIDALRVLAVEPRRYLVATRILACMIALPLLSAISDVVGIAGGMLVGTTIGGINPSAYLQTTVYYVVIGDIVNGLAKTLVFGLIIGATGAYYGFRTEGGTSGVGRSTTASVVASSLMIFVSDVLMTQSLVALGY
jgi:phospholipid/cholesterol/gamma-HCH transport system permease protein